VYGQKEYKMNNMNTHTIPQAESEPKFQTTIRVKHRGMGEDATLLAPTNVHPLERLVSILIGGSLLLWVGRRFVAVVSLTALAAYLIYRGVGGRCMVYETAAIDTTNHDPNNDKGGIFNASSTRAGATRSERTRDKVEQSSWESFPASDPPPTSTSMP
jgi:hypothetical protein